MISQNKYYYTAEIKAEHEMEVGDKWHAERNRIIRKQQLFDHFNSGGSQCYKCGELFAPDKHVNELEKKLSELQAKYNELLKESLEMAGFYGALTSWHSGNTYINTVIDETDMETVEYTNEGASDFDDYGGKRARDFLRKWKK